MPFGLQDALYFVEETVTACLGRLSPKRVDGITLVSSVAATFLVLVHALLEVGLSLLMEAAELLLV